MVIFWGVKGCLGCKKTREFLQKNKIEYIEKDFTKEPFTREELMDILSLTENGFDDIISPRSIAYKKIKKNINNMKFSELVDFIIKNPDVVHRPIILQYVNKKPLRLLIGFNSNDMNILLWKNEESKFKINKCEFLNVCNHPGVGKHGPQDLNE